MWAARAEPVLQRHCVKCHGGVRQRGGLDLRALATVLRGGDEGPAIDPGKPAVSRLIEYVQVGADMHMPPGEGQQLSPDEIAALSEAVAALPTRETLLSDTPADVAAWPVRYIAAVKSAHVPNWIPPEDATIAQAIDGFLQTDWRKRGITPAPACDDRTFVRRLYLDLIGRIPAPAETAAFLADGSSQRRLALIDRLLEHPDHARHLRDVLDVALMERRRPGMGWREYLEGALRANRPWNELVRELIVARPATLADRGAAWFLFERKGNHQQMAEAVAPLVYGARIGCAQCHNHPLTWEIEQRHYWGLVAAFNRSQNVETAQGPGIAESAIGGFVSFTNVDKETRPALVSLLHGPTIDERRPAADEKEIDSPDLYLVPPPKEKERGERPATPKFSRRAALAEAVTTNNPLLARAMVNRFWALLMGRGLVHPVDQMDARHPPSQPDLLDWLSADAERHGYDVRRLVRGIVSSGAYALDSRWPSSEPPAAETFARAIERPLTAEQLERSLLVATLGPPDVEGNFAGVDAGELRRALAGQFLDVFAEQYNATVVQGLFLSNSPFIDQLLHPAGGNTAARLIALPTIEARVTEAFNIVLGRPPDAEELARGSEFLSGRSPEAGVGQLLWALLTSAEFLVNH